MIVFCIIDNQLLSHFNNNNNHKSTTFIPRSALFSTQRGCSKKEERAEREAAFGGSGREKEKRGGEILLLFFVPDQREEFGGGKSCLECSEKERGFLKSDSGGGRLNAAFKKFPAKHKVKGSGRSEKSKVRQILHLPDRISGTIN